MSSSVSSNSSATAGAIFSSQFSTSSGVKISEAVSQVAQKTGEAVGQVRIASSSSNLSSNATSSSSSAQAAADSFDLASIKTGKQLLEVYKRLEVTNSEKIKIYNRVLNIVAEVFPLYKLFPSSFATAFAVFFLLKKTIPGEITYLVGSLEKLLNMCFINSNECDFVVKFDDEIKFKLALFVFKTEAHLNGLIKLFKRK